MFGLFKTATVIDPSLGQLEHRRGLWRGNIALGDTTVPLALSGSRTAPDTKAVEMARSVVDDYDAWRAPIQQALFEHYEPYAPDMSAGDGEAPRIASAADVWAHVRAVFVQVTPFDGAPTVEIGYETAWDEEHTLGARMRDGRLLELCGSVLGP